MKGDPGADPLSEAGVILEEGSSFWGGWRSSALRRFWMVIEAPAGRWAAFPPVGLAEPG